MRFCRLALRALVLPCVLVVATPITPFSEAAFADTTPTAAAGTVLALRGESVSSPDGAAVPLKIGDSVTVGETILVKANAKLKLQMIDGSVIAAGSNSQITIRDYAKSADGKRDVGLDLVSGILRSVVAPAGSGSSFEVTTATGVAAVRSTDWFVWAKENKTTVVGVLKGKVTLTSRATGHEVLIPSGSGAQVRGALNPTTPHKWSKAQFAEVIDLTQF